MSIDNTKNICGNCIEENYFKSHIKTKGVKGVCSYCGKKKRVIKLDKLTQLILEGIEFIYDDPANGLGFVDGEYVKGNGEILDTYDLLCNEFGFGGSKAFEDIVELLPEQLWCKKEFYGLDAAEEKIYTWDSFVNQVKYETRFFFIKEKTNISELVRYKEPFEILEEFAVSIKKFDLIDTISWHDVIYRARKNKNGEKYDTPEQLGTPLAIECIKPNRMSPAGIPMFYGSLTKETCISELRNQKGTYTIGEWVPNKELRILNLTKKFNYDISLNKYYFKNFPSIFDREKREDIFDYKFILKFASDLSGKVEDNIANIEYVPTQIVAEFLRKVALFDGKHIDGICFYSSIDGGINYALFIEQEECKLSFYTDFEQKLWLKSTE